MKLVRVAQMILISFSIITIAACSTPRHGNRNVCGNSAMADANGVQANGIGESENFGGNDMSPAALAEGRNKRVYYFEFDRSDIRPEDKASICANGDYFANHPKMRVTIEGHTDPRGSREYNVALGERRANAVAQLLESRGVNPNQIRVVSYGAQRLAAEGRTEHDFQLDRRAIIVCLSR